MTLWLLGGVAELRHQPPTPRVDLRVALVGPLTSLAAGGGPTGAVTLAALARVPPPLRPLTAIGSLATAAATVEAERLLADAAPLLGPGSTPALVVDHGELVGVLDATDVARVLDLVALGLPPPPTRADARGTAG